MDTHLEREGVRDRGNEEPRMQRVDRADMIGGMYDAA